MFFSISLGKWWLTRIVFLPKDKCLPLLGIKKNYKIAFSYVTRGIIWKNIHARVMVLMHDTSECALQMYEVSLKYLWWLSSYRAYTILWRTDPWTEARGKNIHARVMQFLCMTCRLNVLYKCMKFGWNTSNCYTAIERTRNSIVNDQREITPKISKAELWILCMTRCLNKLYKRMKFCWNNGYQVIEWTRNSIANDQMEITQKISKAELWFLCMTSGLNVLYECMQFR